MPKRKRTLIIALCFILGAGLFIGVLQKMGQKKPGYYEISANVEKGKPVLDNGFYLTLYLDGKSSNIRRESARAQAIYTEALKEIRPLLSAKEINADKNNMAAVVRGHGNPISVDPLLFNILSDIESRGSDAKRFIRQSVLRSIWLDLLYLNDPSEFDPLFNSDTKERIEAIYKAQNEEDCIKLNLNSDSLSASLILSQTFADTFSNYEVEAPPFDLNLLGDAYTLEHLSERLVNEGFSRGYLLSDSGIILSLPDTADIAQPFYGMYEGTGIKAAEIDIKKGEACCTLYAFPKNADAGGYYTLSGIRRHPYLNREGEPNQEILSTAVLSKNGDAPGAVLAALNMFSLNEKEAAEYMSSLLNADYDAALLFSSSPYNIILSPGFNRVVPITDNNFTKSVVPSDK